jgi:hypothetical protein
MSTQQTFYSPAKNLCIIWDTGTIAMGEDGRATRIGERQIQFNDGPDQFGFYTTAKQDEIDYLTERAKQQPKDIYTMSEYADALVPVQQKVDSMSRDLFESNKLLADMRAKQAELEAELEEARKGGAAGRRK